MVEEGPPQAVTFQIWDPVTWIGSALTNSSKNCLSRIRSLSGLQRICLRALWVQSLQISATKEALWISKNYLLKFANFSKKRVRYHQFQAPNKSLSTLKLTSIHASQSVLDGDKKRWKRRRKFSMNESPQCILCSWICQIISQIQMKMWNRY